MLIFALNMRDYGEDNRIPPSSDGTKEGFRSVLAEASDVSYRMFETIQAVAGTTACKGVQINALRKYAVENSTIIYTAQSEGLQTYRSLSPRYSKNAE